MKHIKIFIALVALSFAFSSCNEETPNVPDKGFVAKSNSLTPGELHNALLQAYIDEYGLGYEHDDYSKQAYMDTAHQITEIGIANGMISGSLTPDEFAAASGVIFDELDISEIEYGMDMQHIAQVTIPQIQNLQIRQAFTNVAALIIAENPTAIPQSLLILNSLSGLTVQEQEMVGGFTSVLKESYLFWSKVPGDVQNYRAMLAYVDAEGWRRGMEYGWTYDPSQRHQHAAAAAIAASANYERMWHHYHL